MSKHHDEILVTLGRYPNGAKHFTVSIDGEIVGGVDEKAGGFLPFGCRKPRPTLEDAVRELLWRLMRFYLGKAVAMSKASLEWPIVVSTPAPRGGRAAMSPKEKVRFSEMLPMEPDERVTPYIGYCPHCPLHEGIRTHVRLTEVTRYARQCPSCQRVYIVGAP